MWYRKCIDSSKPPFEIPKEEIKKHPLIMELDEKNKRGELSQPEVMLETVKLALSNQDVLNSLASPLQKAIQDYKNGKIQFGDIFTHSIANFHDYMHPRDIDEAQDRLEDAGYTIDAKDREWIPKFRTIANEIDLDWYYDHFEKQNELSANQHFKRYILPKIPTIAYQLGYLIGRKIDKDELENLLLEQEYNDENVMHKIELVFMIMYLRTKN